MGRVHTPKESEVAIAAPSRPICRGKTKSQSSRMLRPAAVQLTAMAKRGDPSSRTMNMAVVPNILRGMNKAIHLR